MSKIFGGNDSKYNQVKTNLGKRTQSDGLFSQFVAMNKSKERGAYEDASPQRRQMQKANGQSVMPKSMKQPNGMYDGVAKKT